MLNESTPLDEMTATCEHLTQQLASYGLGFQLQPNVIFEQAICKLLIDKGIMANLDEWRLIIATVKRDALAEAVAHAPEIQQQMLAEQAKKKLLVPDHMRSRKNARLN